MGPALLAGAWRDLAVLTWLVEPDALQPYVPEGLALDTWEGRAAISVVGVTFCDLRVLGVPAPGLQTFTQVNVRIYVRRCVDDEVRHGVRFLLELAPSAAVVAGARLTLHEPYRACDMHLDDVRQAGGRRSMTYAWRDEGWHCLRMLVDATRVQEPGSGSFETFVLQRCWGYTPQPDGTTLEYAVRHPLWQVRTVHEADLEARWSADALPADLAAMLARPVTSRIFADGSAIEVHRPKRLGCRPET